MTSILPVFSRGAAFSLKNFVRELEEAFPCLHCSVFEAWDLSMALSSLQGGGSPLQGKRRRSRLYQASRARRMFCFFWLPHQPGSSSTKPGASSSSPGPSIALETRSSSLSVHTSSAHSMLLAHPAFTGAKTCSPANASMLA